MSRPRRISYCAWPWEMLARGIAALLYQVRAVGRERMPATGGVLLIANHLSYVDMAALQMASPRKLRFIGYRGAEGNWLFDWVFRQAGVIALASGRPAEAIKASIQALERGEVVCIFPEGMISRTGQLMELQRGFELIARKGKAVVVPAAIDGLWGSIFSFSGNRYVWKWPRILRTHVAVVFGAPLREEQVNPRGARRALLELGAAAFELRPRLKRHVGWTIACSLAARPGRIALVDCTGAPRPVTAGQLYAAASALARRIRDTVPDSRIGVALPPGAGCTTANLAIWWAGKTPVNLNFTVGREAAASALATAGIQTVVSANVLKARMPEFPWPARTLDLRAELDQAGGKGWLAVRFVAAWLLPRQWAARLAGAEPWGGKTEAALLFTSGSSGKPKGVVLTHSNILANCEQLASLGILPRSAVLLGCLPIFHSFGFTANLCLPLIRRCGLVTVPSPLDTRKMLDAIRTQHVSVMIGAPTFLRPMLKRGEPAELRTLRFIVSGAERLPDDLAAGFREKFQLPVLQGYGLTEMSPVVSLNQPNPPVTTATANPQAGSRPGTVGRLMPGLAAKILDPDTGAEKPLDETGIVCFKGANVFAGYLDDPAATAHAIQDGWFVTGDLAHFDAEGFLIIAGRRSRFSKIGGEMVPHGTIEQRLGEAFQVDAGDAPEFVVVGVPDAAKGEALVLVSAREVTPDQVREALSGAGMPNLWIPKVIKRVEQIPLLPTGKIDLAGCAAIAKG